MALSDQGEVYTWGYGGKEGYFAWMFSQEVGALGHNDKKPHMTPKLVQYFKDNNVKIKSIGAGMYHSVAVSQSGEFYTWGRGLYGALGNGSNQYHLQPTLNPEINALTTQGAKITKIDCAEDYTGVLLSTNELFVFGKNDRG